MTHTARHSRSARSPLARAEKRSPAHWRFSPRASFGRLALAECRGLFYSVRRVLVGACLHLASDSLCDAMRQHREVSK